MIGTLMISQERAAASLKDREAIKPVSGGSKAKTTVNESQDQT
jgi:hypothetical protein